MKVTFKIEHASLISAMVLTCLLAMVPLVNAENTSESTDSISVGKGLLLLELEEQNFRLWLDARIYIDAAFYNEKVNSLSNGTELRHGRLALKSQVHNNWLSELDLGFAKAELEVKDAWIAYTTGRLLIRAGQSKEPFSLEQVTSSRYITFLERALPNVLVPSRNIGIAASYYSRYNHISLGLFGQEVRDGDVHDDEGYGITGRATFTPINRTGLISHLGLSVSRRTPDANSSGKNRFRFRTRPETFVSRTRFLNTDWINSADYLQLIGVEAAAVYKSLMVQSEYISATVSRTTDLADVNFAGAYVYCSWFPFGESRPYVSKDGEFGQVIPRKEYGSLELALRYSWLNLNDSGSDVLGGEAESLTFGINWFANSNVRVMVNYTLVNNDHQADGAGSVEGNDDFHFLQMRIQFNL